MAATISYGGNGTQQGNATSFTFTAVGIGTAAADRYVLAIFGGVDASATSGTSVSSVMIGGNAATVLDTQNRFNGTRDSLISAAILLVTSGTTANIVVTVSHTYFGMIVHAYALYGLGSATPHASFKSALASVSTSDLSLNVPASGVAAAGCLGWDNTTTHTWSGLTEGGEAGIFSGAHELSAAGDAFASAQSPLNLDVNLSASEANVLGMSFSFAGVSGATRQMHSYRQRRLRWQGRKSGLLVPSRKIYTPPLLRKAA